MKLKEVKLCDLSSIEYTVYISECRPYETPETMVIKYSGRYRDGSGGKPDARYIVATATAAHEAWYTHGIIIDFSELEYHIGDEMDWVFSIGSADARQPYPLAVIVGDGCRDSLYTLSPEDYGDYCVETFDEALRLIRKKREEYAERKKKQK